jgi:hypothetical protein
MIPPGGLDDARDNLDKDACVLLHQVQSALAWFLIRSGGNHGYGRSRAVQVVAGPDARRVREWHRVAEVHRLVSGALTVDVDQDDFRR